MTKNDTKNFSTELSDCGSIGDHVESVSHPVVKQVLNQILADGNVVDGSGFGEGLEPAG